MFRVFVVVVGFCVSDFGPGLSDRILDNLLEGSEESGLRALGFGGWLNPKPLKIRPEPSPGPSGWKACKSAFKMKRCR